MRDFVLVISFLIILIANMNYKNHVSPPPDPKETIKSISEECTPYHWHCPDGDTCENKLQECHNDNRTICNDMFKLCKSVELYRNGKLIGNEMY